MGYDFPGLKRKTPLRRKTKFNVDPELNRLAGNPRGSKLERAVYQILLLREKAGEISQILQQRRVDLGDGIYWAVDFSFFDLTKPGHPLTWAEAKGVKSGRYNVCKKLWNSRGPGPLEIWEGDYRQPKLVKIIIPRQ